MTPKFEYPGFMLPEDDKRFVLMREWADYYGFYRKHTDLIHTLGNRVLGDIMSNMIQPADNEKRCKEYIDHHIPGMNNQMDDLESAVNDMQGWQLSWSEVGSNPYEPTHLTHCQGWVVDGSIMRNARSMSSGAMAWVRVSNMPGQQVSRAVNMAQMREIKFFEPVF